jgi:hypothetical protein
MNGQEGLSPMDLHLLRKQVSSMDDALDVPVSMPQLEPRPATPGFVSDTGDYISVEQMNELSSPAHSDDEKIDQVECVVSTTVQNSPLSSPVLEHTTPDVPSATVNEVSE